MLDRIRYMLSKSSRYYTENEIETISKKYNINLEKILRYILCKGDNDEFLDMYISALRQNGKVWIGETECNKKFAEKHAKFIVQEAEAISRNNCNRYGCRYLQSDIASDSIVYILQKCGDIGKNFSDDDKKARKFIRLRIKTYIKYKYISQIGKPKEYSFHREFSYKGNQNASNVFNKGIKDDSVNLEDEVEEKVLSGEKQKEKENIGEECAELLMLNIKKGLPLGEALETTGYLVNLSKEELLENLRDYMIKTKKARGNDKKGFVLGEW